MMSLRLAKYAILSDGRFVRILCGAEGDDDENKDDNGGAENDGGNTGGTETDDGSSGTGSSTGTVSPEEYEKLKQRMQAADRRASEYETKIREFEDRDKTATQRLEGQIQNITEENKKLREDLKASRRDNAFLTTNGVTWHDASMALGNIDWDTVTDEQGEVNTSALKKEIERLAKEKPFLVKASTSGSSGGGNGKDKQGPSGHHPGGSTGDKKTADRAALEKKYPALRR
jgi:hypothetical protein